MPQSGSISDKANEERARLLAEANANVDRVSRKESIRCNPLRVQNVDDWGTVVVIFPDNFDFADVYLNGKCEFSGKARHVIYMVPYGSYEVRAFQKPFQDFTIAVELSPAKPTAKVQVKLTR